MLVSVVIDNFNYGRFIREAIDSALAQTYAPIEVVVVDDGSTDDSRPIIESYGARVRSVFKVNGGQASALNAGIAASHGEVVVFLDSDDVLYPGAVSTAVSEFQGAENVAKVQWPLAIIDETGRRRGDTKPPQPPPQGDLRNRVLEKGPTNCVSSPTSGNAWSLAFLNWVMPIPEHVHYYRICADEYLYTLAPIFGRVINIPEVQGLYRIHGKNIYSARSFEQKLQLELDGHEQQCCALSAFLQKRGIEVDLDKWRSNSWFHRLDRSIRDLRVLLPSDAEVVLIDDGTWDACEALSPRPVKRFNERDGAYWGPPADDALSLAELNRLRDAGATHVVVAWPAFWWIEHYRAMFDELQRNAFLSLDDERMVVFDLRAGASP